MNVAIISSSADLNRTTLQMAERLIAAVSANPSMVELARSIVRNVHTREEETECVCAWIHANITYRLDPDGVQYLQGPLETLRLMSGNCDCMATLAGALLASLGHQVNPLGVVWQGDQFATHCVLFDASSELVVDPVSGPPCDLWPPKDYILDHFTRSW